MRLGAFFPKNPRNQPDAKELRNIDLEKSYLKITYYDRYKNENTRSYNTISNVTLSKA